MAADGEQFFTSLGCSGCYRMDGSGVGPSLSGIYGKSDLMSGLTFKVADIAKVRDAAKAKGCNVSGDAFDLCGVTFRLVT